MRDFLKALETRPLVVCAGSRAADGLSTPEILEDIWHSLPEGAGEAGTDPGESWLLGSYLRHRLGSRLAAAIRDRVDGAALRGELAAAATLPVHAVLTTSFGDEWQRAFSAAGEERAALVPADDELVTATGRCVVHLFGDARRADSLLLSSADVARAYDDERRAWLADLWQHTTFLFVGFSASDADLRTVLEQLLPADSHGQHFAFLPRATLVQRAELSESYGIQLLSAGGAGEIVAAAAALPRTDWYGGGIGEDDLDEILEGLAAAPGDEALLLRLSLLETRLAARGQHERLVDLHLGRTCISDDPGERAASFLAIARLLADDIGDPARAFAAVAAAYRELPSSDIGAELAARARDAGAEAELAALLVETAPRLSADERRRAVTEAVDLLADHLGQPERALEALALAPDDAALARRRRELLRRTERWAELASCLEAAEADDVSSIERAELARERGEILRDRLADPRGAIAAFRVALACDLRQAAVRAALAALYEELGDADSLVELLRDRADLEEGAERIAALVELGELCERLGRTAEAVAAYEAVRCEMPNHAHALDGLDRLYAQLEQGGDRVRVLRDLVGVADAGARRAEIYRDLARAHEARWEEEAACEAWEFALADEPDCEIAFAALDRHYRDDARWALLVDLHERRAKVVTGDERVALLCSVAALYERHLGDLGRALDVLTDARALAPADLRVTEALAQVSERKGLRAEAAGLYEEIAAEREGAERAAALRRAGSAWLAAGELAAAAEALAAAIELERDAAALALFAQVRRRQGQFSDAAELFSEAARAAAVSERCALWVDAGRAYLDGGDRVSARRACDEALAAEAPDAAALDSLVLLCGQVGDSDRQLAALGQLLEAASSDPARAAAHGRLSALLASSGRLDEAAAHAELAAALSPDQLAATMELARLHLRRGAWKEASALCERLAESLRDGSDAAVDVLCWRARCASGLGDRAGAERLARRAWKARPFHREALELLCELSRDDPHALIDYKKSLLMTADEGEMAPLLIEIGDLCLERLESVGDARDFYEAARRLSPGDHLVLHRCVSASVELGDWRGAIELLGQLIDTEPTPELRARYRLAAAQIFSEELGDPARALEAMSAAFADAPTNERSFNALAAALREQEDWARLASVYVKRLEAGPGTADPPTLARLWAELAELCLERVGDRDSAVCALEVAARLDPEAIEHAEALAAACARAGDEERAIAEHRRIVARRPERVASYEALAALHARQGEVERSAACHEAARLLRGELESASRRAAELRAPLLASDWAELAHPDEDRVVSALLAALLPAVAALRVSSLRRPIAQRTRLRDHVRGEALEREVARLCRALDVPTPEICLAHDSPVAAVPHARVSGSELLPVLLVSPAILAEGDEARRAFVLARALACFRRERLVRVLVADERALARILEAALALGRDDEEEDAAAAQLASLLSPAVVGEVRRLARALAAGGDDVAAIAERWWNASARSAERAGLLAAGDLAAAAAALSELLAARPAAEREAAIAELARARAEAPAATPAPSPERARAS